LIFEWNTGKSRVNLRKHGLDFADAEQMFSGPLVGEPDTRHYEEGKEYETAIQNGLETG
jgi:uncharacterized protein